VNDSRPLARHVSGLLADLAAEHGEVEVVRRRWDCEPNAYDALVETFERFGVVGGATARVRDDDGRLLLVRGADTAAVSGGDDANGRDDPGRHGGPEGERSGGRSPGAWTDPGDARRPGEGYRECARRAVREATGVDIQFDGLEAVHIHLASDWTDRPPLPDPALVFAARPRGQTALEPGDGVGDAGWFAELPDELLYEGLREAALDSAPSTE
jgi:ADP-ribose pyrophosphatase YjhB (NUDIX family)